MDRIGARHDASSARYVQTMLKYRQAIFEVGTLPRRRFLQLAGWASVLAILPTKAAIASARPFSRIGDLMISHDALGITINGRVRLTGKESKLLTLLWVHKDIVLSREIMLRHLYAGVDQPELKIIDVFISMLRFKIAKATNGGGSIKLDAVSDRGYVLRET
jgi:DNA-binding response OmpR family regulator